MTDLQVRIVRLEPMRVACASGFGESPEMEAWGTILAWAESQGLLQNLQVHRFFGYNNPDPSPGSPNYGYDQWITLQAGECLEGKVQAQGKVKIHEFPGGLYGVTRCYGIPTISETWKKLVTWREDSHYKPAYHQYLEECLTPPGTPPEQMIMDLYIPIAE